MMTAAGAATETETTTIAAAAAATTTSTATITGVMTTGVMTTGCHATAATPVVVGREATAMNAALHVSTAAIAVEGTTGQQ